MLYNDKFMKFHKPYSNITLNTGEIEGYQFSLYIKWKVIKRV